jgi:cytochrome c oxidase cbb3-type subunit III
MIEDNKHDQEIDKVSGVETTGHDWDGIKELNNPAPRWWLWVFYICCIWSFGYWIVYPAWPTWNGHTPGIWGVTQQKELDASQSEIMQRQQMYLDKFEKASFDEILKDPELYVFATTGGAVAFKTNCATCHGSGGAGGHGYPNLNDDDWLWGGKITDIHQTLMYGIRAQDDETRVSQMPAFGKDGLLKADQISAVVGYTHTLSGGEPDTSFEKGKEIFSAQCASCHGPEGKGGRDFGAPNLTDKIWLYGGDRDTMYKTVFYGRGGMMPNWSERLDAHTLRQLAVYVHQLGGGEPATAEPMADEGLDDGGQPTQQPQP